MRMQNENHPERILPDDRKGKIRVRKAKGLRRRRYFQGLFFFFFRLSALINVAALGLLLYFILSRGWHALSPTFLTKFPSNSMTEGGILPCIVGTLGLSAGAILVALPIGVFSAIYLNEYTGSGKIVQVVRFAIRNLAGIPSVVFGLFGLAFFCILLGMGVGLAAGSLTLGIMILPLIIGATEESLDRKSVV